MHRYLHILKRILLVLWLGLSTGGTSVYGQICDNYYDLIVYKYSGTSCGPGNITLMAELISFDLISSGEFRWYETQTSTMILKTDPCNNEGATSFYTYYATEGSERWVSVYDNTSGCETERQPFIATLQPAGYPYQEFARSCGNGTAQIQYRSSTGSGTFFLYRFDNGYYTLLQSNSSGYFEIYNYTGGLYYVRAQIGGCGGTSDYSPVQIEIADPTPPTFVGTPTVCQGESTMLSPFSNNSFTLRWYDANDNFLEEVWDYHTPNTLAPGVHTYIVRGVSEQGCLTEPASVNLTVFYKPVNGSISSNVSTICLGQEVTISSQGGIGLPNYWCTSNGGASWNVFAGANSGKYSFTHKPAAIGTYRYYLYNYTECGYCWDYGGTCTNPYVEVTVVTPPPVTFTVTTPTVGQGNTRLTASISTGFYQWQYNGENIPGATERTYNAGCSGNYSVIVTSNTGCVSVSAPVFVTISNNYNYIITNTMKKPGVITNDQVDALSFTDKLQSIAYFDGIGRNIQEVGTQVSSGNKDVVTFTDYDAANRITKEFLPYTEGTDGSFKTNAIGSQSTFYQGLKGDGLAFAETRFDNSPINRALEKGSAGAAWQIGTGHTQRISYSKNTWGEITIWNYDPASHSVTGIGSYSNNELYVTETINPNGQKSVEYKNKSGLVVCSKVQKIPGDDNSYQFSYNVYDALQNLRVIVSPEAVKNLASVNYAFSYNDAFSKTWLRWHNYDERNRLVSKRSPGAEEEYLVYDSRDRVVLTQDGNLRAKGLWLAMLYDTWDREIITARVTSSAGLAAMQDAVNTQTADPLVYDPQITIIEGVPVHKNPLAQGTPYEVLAVSYYDDYSWVANSGTLLSDVIDATYTSNGNYFITSSASPLYAQPVTPNYHVRGKVTGAKTKVLGSSNQYLYSVSFYDEEGRVIQVQSINQTGGKDIITNQYDFSGNLLRSLQQHEKHGGAQVQNNMVLTKNEYLRNGKVEKVYVKINSDPDHLIASHTYNEIGELQQKVLGNNRETLDYAYNIQGWLTTINKDFLQEPDNTTSPSRWFGMELAYENTTSVVANTSYGTTRYNGSVTASLWRTRGSGVKRKFEYVYDNLDRLIASNFKQQFGSVWGNSDPNNQNFNIDFSEGGNGNGNQFIEYDDNGNIQNVWRKGLKVNSSPFIDKLTYGYTGNKLDIVTDLHSDANTKLGDFHDGLNAGNDYLYDPNGNLSKDDNKGISAISYNHLDLPEVLTISNTGGATGTITYTYDAAGNKLKKIIVDNSIAGKTIITTTDYFGSVTYESRTVTNPGPDEIPDYNEKLQSITHDEGRIRWVQATSGSGGSFVYDYFVLDHAGNVRVILTEEQKTDPYPMASMEDVPNKHDVNDANNYIPYYANTDYTTNAGVRYAISSVGGYPTTGDVNATPVNNYVAKLNGSGSKVGQSMVLKVMAGDEFNVRASSWYKANGSTPDEPVNPLLDLVSILAAGAGNIPGSKVSSLDLQNSNFLGPNIERFLNDKDVQPGRPKAYLNWVFLDDQFQYVESGSSFEQVPDESYFNNGTSTPRVKWLGSNGISATRNGYLYVYVSNETPNIDVFFDNLQVTHVRGPLLEESHYYPMGMEMAGICSRAPMEAFARNKHKYQGQEYESSLGLHMYEFEARQYDAQLGRFVVQDPVVNGHSPYAAMNNNPMTFVDPDGRDPLVVAAIIGALMGAFQGYQMAAAKGYDMNDGKFWGYVLGGAAIGAASGYAGANIAGAGGFMSQTMGMVFGSTASSLGMTMLSGMETKPNINFGVASFDMGTMELNYLGKKGNSLLQNFGYLTGALANVQDIMAGVNGMSIEVKARKEVAGHSQTNGEYTTLDAQGHEVTKKILISVGPEGELSTKNGKGGLKWEWEYVKKQLQGAPACAENYDYMATDPRGGPVITRVNNVNRNILQKFSDRLSSGKNLNGVPKTFTYGVLKGCVNYNARALFRAGVLNFNALLPVTHPLLLNAELGLRQLGIYASPYLIQYGR